MTRRTWSGHWHWIVIGVVTVGGGCSRDAEPGLTAPARFELGAVPNCAPRPVISGDFVPTWPCNTDVRVWSQPAFSSALPTAILRWNAALGHSTGQRNRFLPGTPRFVLAADSVNADLRIVSKGGSGAYYCGDNVGTNFIRIGRRGQLPAEPCNGNASAQLDNTLTHELAHHLGFTSSLHAAGAIPLHCTIRLSQTNLNSIGGLPCQHEAEVVHAAYSYRDIDPTAFWNKAIITAITGLPDTISVQEGLTVTAAIDSLRFALQNGHPSEPPGSRSFTWTIPEVNQRVVASVAPQGSQTAIGRITGLLTGEARVVVVPTGGLSGVLVSAQLLAGAAGADVVVTPAPQVIFKVTDIVADTTPFTVAGSEPLEAVVQRPASLSPSVPVSVRWQVSYSNGGNYDTGFVVGTSHAVNVPAGSYQITVQATPRVGDSTGYYAIRHFPVCTGGGGGEFLLAPVDTLGQPNAKQGC